MYCDRRMMFQISAGNTVRLPPALIQPMAAEDVASAVCRVALGPPLNGTVEIGGPEKFHLDELVRRALAARKDPREVVADPQAPYYGIKVSENTLIPGKRGVCSTRYLSREQ